MTGLLDMSTVDWYLWSCECETSLDATAFKLLHGHVKVYSASSSTLRGRSLRILNHIYFPLSLYCYYYFLTHEVCQYLFLHLSLLVSARPCGRWCFLRIPGDLLETFGMLPGRVVITGPTRSPCACALIITNACFCHPHSVGLDIHCLPCFPCNALAFFFFFTPCECRSLALRVSIVQKSMHKTQEASCGFCFALTRSRNDQTLLHRFLLLFACPGRRLVLVLSYR